MAKSRIEKTIKDTGKSYWLLVERLENWLLDKESGFQEFGLPDRKRKMGSDIKKGDLLIFYVADGISCLADIREAEVDGIAKLRMGGNYDTAFTWCVRTKPFLTLSRASWVPFKTLTRTLSITRRKKDWRHVVRNSLRRLELNDASLIIESMKQAAKKSVV